MKSTWMKLILVCLLLIAAPIAGAMGQVSIEASVGYDQTILNGRWFPLEVQMKNDGEAMQGVLSVDLMQSLDRYDRYEYPVSLEAGDTVVRFPISTLIPQRVFRITLTADGEQMAETMVSANDAVDDQAMLIGTLGADDALLHSLRAASHEDALKRGEEMEVIALDDVFGLLDERELAAFQMLIIDQFDLQAMDDMARKRLKRWLDLGGLLLCSSGAQGDWLSEEMGVTFGAATESADAISALLAYADATEAEQLEASAIYPVLGGQEALAVDGAGQVLLTKASCGDGMVLALGLDLDDPQLLEQLEHNALLQRVLLAALPQQYLGFFGVNHRGNYTYGSVLNDEQRIGGTSMAPAALLLAVYMLLVGPVLYIWMKRRDRSHALWILLPAAAALCAGLMGVLAATLNLNAPTAASFHITAYDEAGVARAEERALVAYADQTPVRISAGEATVERAEYGYFYANAQADEQAALRDTITLGESPSITLSPVAPWLARSLVVRSDALPEGNVTGSAWMEEDGLHAEIHNNTQIGIENAVLLTSLGYATIGRIAAGDSCEVVIARPQEITRTKEGEQAILESELLEIPVSLSSVIHAKVYPQAQLDETFEIDEQEQHAAEKLERRKMTLAVSGGNFSCVLYGETPDIRCATLYKDGKPIARAAEESILSAKLAFNTRGKTGVFYYPLGMIPAVNARIEGDRPIMDREARAEDEPVYGFDLSAIERSDIRSIRISTSYYYASGDEIAMQVYDWAADAWITLRSVKRAELDATLMQRVINQRGELFIRYTAPAGMLDVSVPEIIVEGSEQE